MYKGIIDTHAHYNDECFSIDMEEILSSLPEKGIANIINCGTDTVSSDICLQLAEKYDCVYAAAGIHPSDCLHEKGGWEEKLKEQCGQKKCVAVGEIGLDYHYDDTPKDIQLEFFEKQLILANELSMPVIVHDREAHLDTMNLLKKYKPAGVMHCFSGSVEMMYETLAIGMYIGLGGAVTFKNAKKPVDVARTVPLDRLLLETDCPYMTPVPFRGKRNDSSLIPYTAEFIAELRGMDTQELIDIAADNARKLFGIG